MASRDLATCSGLVLELQQDTSAECLVAVGQSDRAVSHRRVPFVYTYVLTLYVCLLMRYHYGVRPHPCANITDIDPGWRNTETPPSNALPGMQAPWICSPVLKRGCTVGQVYARIRQRYIVQGETDTSDWCVATAAALLTPCKRGRQQSRG